MATLARRSIACNVTINGLLPGPFNTDRLIANAQKSAAARGMTFEQVQALQREAHPAKRFGDPSEFGHTAAFLCSVHAGFITGQNIMMDGGKFGGLL